MKLARKTLFSVLFACPLFSAVAQQLDPDYSIKTAGSNYHRLTLNENGETFVYGVFDDFNGEDLGRLLRLDHSGNPVAGFQPLYADNPIFDVLPLPDGKIMISGTFTQINGQSVPPILRLNADGSIDETFSCPLTSYGNMEIQSTGKIVVLSDYKFERLNSDGSLDQTFQFENYAPAYRGFKIGPDNSIYFPVFSNVYKLTPDGADDISFDSGADNNGYIWTITVQPDSKILVAGSFSSYNGVPAKAMVRVNSDGSLDDSFSVGNNIDGGVYQILARSNGNIVIGGQFPRFGGEWTSLVELNADGTLYKKIASVSINNIESICENADHEITIGGEFTSANGYDVYGICRFNADYSFDELFIPMVTYNNANGMSLVVDDAMRATLAAEVRGRFEGSVLKPGSLFRFDETGAHDDTFAPNFPFSFVLSQNIQADGKVLLSGAFGNNNWETIRLNEDGSVDNSFDIGAGPTGGLNGVLYGIAPIDDLIYLGGSFTHFNGIPSSCLVAVNSDGSVAQTFHGLQGEVIIGDIAKQSDGKIVVSGNFFFDRPDSRDWEYILRFNADGSLDDSFHPPLLGTIGKIQVDVDDNIYIVGLGFQRKDNYEGLTGLVRLTPDGQIDGSFNASASLPPYHHLYSVIILPDGRLAVGGIFEEVQGVEQPAFTILNANGTRSLDEPLFGKGSVVFDMHLKNGQLFIAGNLKRRDYTHASSLVKLDLELPPLPPAPSNLVVSLTDPGVVTVSWSADDSDQHSFVIERAVDNLRSFVAIDTVETGVSEYVDTIARTHFHTYRVRAISDVGASPYSNKDSLLWAPRVEGVLMLSIPTPTSANVTLSWQGPILYQDGFIVGYKTAGSPDFVVLDSVSASSNSFMHVIEREKEYQYRIIAYNQKGSLSTQPVSIKWAPAPQGSLSLNASTPTEPKVTLSWSGAVVYHNGFIVEVKTPGSSAYLALDTVSVSSFSFTHPVARNVKYSFRVRAFNTAGVLSSEVVSVEWLPIPNGNLILGITTSAGEAELSWPGTILYHDGFIIERSSSLNSGYEPLASIGPNETTFTDVTNGRKPYHYQIVAYNSNGEIVSNKVSMLATAIEPDAENEIKIFPNPASEYLLIQHGTNVVQKISIVNPGGQIIFPVAEERFGELAVHLDTLPAGVFVIQMLVDGKNLTRRFVKK